MGSSSVRSIFDKGTEAFNAHDIEAMMETCADDVVTRAPGGPAFSGKEATKAFYAGWIAAFPDARVEIEAVHEAGDTVIEEGVFRGTHQATLHGPGGDLPATGRAVRVGYIQVVRFLGDRIASFHLMFDRVEMLEQLGLARSPEAEQARSAEMGSPSQTMQ